MNHIIYHADCVDGKMAAAVVTKFTKGVWTQYPCNYGEPVPDISWCKGDKLFIVDFSFPREDLVHMAEKFAGDNIRVFDHHKSAEAELEGLPFCHFDQERCGSTLAWVNLNPGFKEGDGFPELLNYIEDWDLGRRKLQYTKEINAFLFSHLNGSLEIWQDLLPQLEYGDRSPFTEGRSILRYRSVMVERACRTPIALIIGNNSVLGTFADGSIDTDVAERMIQGSNLFGVSLSVRGTKVKVSLRSGPRGEERCDVSKVAKQYGGGGHKGAAGFTLELEEFIKLIVR